jgi:hypothetical protein
MGGRPCTFKRVISLILPYSIIIRAEQRWQDSPIPRPLTFRVKLGPGISV